MQCLRGSQSSICDPPQSILADAAIGFGRQGLRRADAVRHAKASDCPNPAQLFAMLRLAIPRGQATRDRIFSGYIFLAVNFAM
jgi:hypothetical protein